MHGLRPCIYHLGLIRVLIIILQLGQCSRSRRSMQLSAQGLFLFLFEFVLPWISVGGPHGYRFCWKQVMIGNTIPILLLAFIFIFMRVYGCAKSSHTRHANWMEKEQQKQQQRGVLMAHAGPITNDRWMRPMEEAQHVRPVDRKP